METFSDVAATTGDARPSDETLLIYVSLMWSIVILASDTSKNFEPGCFEISLQEFDDLVSPQTLGVPPLLLDPVFLCCKKQKLLFRFCVKHTQYIQYSETNGANLTCKTCNEKYIGISEIFRRYR
jgi:hypothetical protein